MNVESAKKLLFDVDDILKKFNISYFLMGGALLGAVRDKDFISEDNDIDLGIFIDIWALNNFAEILDEFQNKNIFINNLAANCVFNITRDDTPCDICYHKKINNYYMIRGCTWEFHIPEKYLDKLDTVSFLGREFKIPSNVEEFLDNYYNNNWRTKCPKAETKFGWIFYKGKVKKRISFPLITYLYENNTTK